MKSFTCNPMIQVIGLIWSLCICLHPSIVEATTNIILVRGNKMYDSKTGERFFIKGLTYEYAVSDKYYEEYSRDAIRTNLDGLNFNTIRLYNINPDESYDLFMKDMQEMGIYVLIPASPDNDPYYGKYRYSTITKKLGPNGKVTEAKNGVKTMDITDTCYPALLLEYGKRIIKKFASYDNTLGIVVANEIMQTDLTPAACVKQYVADLKNWMWSNAKKMRIVPLTYAEADSAAKSVPDSDDYLTMRIQGLLCGDKMKDGLMTKSIDIFLLNEYRWCDDSNFDKAYKRLVDMASGLPIVIALGEYGCKEKGDPPRKWAMVEYHFSSPEKTFSFSDVFSGGAAYAYGQAKLPKDSMFPMFTGGSVEISGKPSNNPTADYKNLKAAFAKYIPYSDPAEWSSGDKCKWVPTMNTKISSANERVTENGWILPDCDNPAIKLDKDDTWITKTREGAICADDGSTCDVMISSKIGTTQEDLCGELVIESGGAVCYSSSDCGVNGQCIDSGKGKVCECLPCYTGLDCNVKDISSCSQLSSSKEAPKLIFIGMVVCLFVMLLVFVALAVVARRKANAIEKLGNQLKLRVPTAETNSF